MIRVCWKEITRDQLYLQQCGNNELGMRANQSNAFTIPGILFVFTFVILTMTGLTFSSLTLDTFATPGTSTLFGIDASNGNLITINPSTGIPALVGNTFEPISSGSAGPSLAVDPNTGKMYASTFSNFGLLLLINPSTGAPTVVGPLVNAINAPGLDFRSDGTLFATANVGGAGTGGSQLATINPNTGLVTIIGPLMVSNMGAIAFAPDGTLYGATENKGLSPFGALYTINTTTGVATFVTAIRDSNSDPHPGGFASIQFGCDGTLYYGGGSSFDANIAGDFGTININTGVFTQTFFQTATGSLGGLAFADPCPIIEEDSDGDGVADSVDNCPDDFNPNQLDMDIDNTGDACDELNLMNFNSTLMNSTVSVGNVLVTNSSEFIISENVSLNVTSGNNITIENGSRVIIAGTLRVFA
jgi:hypothetical protein